MRDYVLVLNAGSSSLKFGVKPEDEDWLFQWIMNAYWELLEFALPRLNE